MGMWLRETLNSSHHQGMTLLTFSWKVIGADRNKGELRKEKRSGVILSNPHVLVSGSALGGGRSAVALSGKQSSWLQKLQLLSPCSFFFFFSLTGFNPGPRGQISGRDLTPEAWRNKVISSPSATPKRTSSLRFLKQRRLFCR